MSYESEVTAQAFNQGCDARLMGTPINQCPFNSMTDGPLYKYWRNGWQHTEDYWGKGARRGRQIPSMPVIVES